MSDDWTELSALFDELVGLDDAERATRLREIGVQDAALRARLEAMLAADAEATGRLRDHEAVVARSIAAAGERSERDPLGLIGTTVGRYRMDALLGAGGMGVVYRATDERLGRPAALKFLPPVWSLDERAKQRFLHEARAASSLDHSNVCTIYEADEAADGTLYIAMALYEGETLRDRLEHGPLAVVEALDVAAQVAQGLAAAHAQGLVHRDIKPANLLVTTDGVLKILDFGVAKAADIGLTMTEQRPGTMAYMAPEQARGDAVDGRSDLWSLGVVLYEMLTGERPAGAGHATEPVPAPSTLRATVPASIDALVLQLLAYDPSARPERAEDLLAALEPEGRTTVARARVSHNAAAARGRAISYVGVGILIAVVGIGSYVYVQDGTSPFSPSGAAAASPRHLAVLPFTNNSPNDENEYFADGVTDDVLAHLAQVPDFAVISRTATMGYKGSAKTVSEIADELGVEYVLAGTVRRADEQVRITAELVDSRNDHSVWAQTYDRQLEDIFAVQTEIARSIVEALEVELSSGVTARIERPLTEDTDAYDLFLLGRESLYRYDVESIKRAIELFGRALERDPEFSLARAWLARAYALYFVNHGMGASWADSAIAAARQALEEQPDLPDAHNALGAAFFGTGQYREAMTAFERALELNPNDWAAMVNLANVYQERGHRDEAILTTHGSLERDPVRAHYAHANMAVAYLQLGLLDRAESALERALAVAPDDPYIMFIEAWLNVMRGRPDTAIAIADRVATHKDDPRAGWFAAVTFVFTGEAERARDAAETAYALSPTLAFGPYHLGVLYGYALERSGEHERADSVFNETVRYAQQQIEAGSEMAGLRYSLAGIHALRGEHDQAFHWLNEAFDFGWNHTEHVALDPLLESLRSDPRFQDVMDRMERQVALMHDRLERELAPMRDRVEREGL